METRGETGDKQSAMKEVTYLCHVYKALMQNVSSFLSSESLMKMSNSAFPGNCCGVNRSPMLCDSPGLT